jgi:hypothetical protein
MPGYPKKLLERIARWRGELSNLALITLVAGLAIPSLYIAVEGDRYLQPRYGTDERDLYSWARTTDPSSIFLVSPTQSDFRLGAERGIVVNFKCVPFYDDLILEWHDRMMAVSGGLEFARGTISRYRELDDAYGSLSQRDLEEVALTYNASFIVTGPSKSLDMELVFENGGYRVYGLGSP